MPSSVRDEFRADVKRTVAFRVGGRCSICYEPTSGPQVDPTKALNLGVAAHITAASSGGPRYDPQLTPAQRRDVTNAIWLCQKCAKLIDNDLERFSATELRNYKEVAEVAALELLHKSNASTLLAVTALTNERGAELAARLAQSQVEKFRWVRRYPFREIDRIKIGDALRLNADQLGGAEKTQLRVPISQIIHLNRANILVGEPGAGKSTALQQVTHDAAELFLATKGSMPPLYVDLKWQSGDLLGLVESTVLDLCPGFNVETISRFILTSPVLFYFDSFDEAPNTGELLRDLKTFVSQHPHSRFVVASRPNELLGNLDFFTYELTPLNRAQIREILELYLQPYLKAEDVWRIYEDIQQFSLFAELGNPMMLWFFSLAIRDVKPTVTPESLGKGKIFSRVVEEFFLANWEPKSLKPWALRTRRYVAIKMGLLSSLARKMVEDDDRAVADTSWVFEEFVAELSAQYPNPSDLAHDLIDQILTHHLLEEKDSYLAFWHKSLRNYFAAKSLTTEKDLSCLTALVSKAEWHESIVMLASLDSRMAVKINDLACVDPVVALDCLMFSPLLQIAFVVESVVPTALTAFFSDRQIEQRVRIIQRVASLYKKAPDLINQVIFLFLHGEDHKELRSKYESLIRNASALPAAVEKVRTALTKSQIEATIESRAKTFSSVIRKISVEDEDQIWDLFGIRIITHDIRDCYAAVGNIHSLWKPIPGFFKDYIAVADNGYQGLHSSVLLEGGIPLEVIIQTSEMHEYSQRTRLAYLESKDDRVFLELEKRQTELGLPMIPLRTQLHGDQKIAVFTPNDGVLLLPEDATVLDCAHRIHSEVFAHCKGAIVNGGAVHRGYPLKNLDHIEILTDPLVKPELEWMASISSTSSQKALGRILRKCEEAEALSVGKKLVDAYMNDVRATEGIDSEFAKKTLMRRFGLHKIEDVYKGVGRGKYHLTGSLSKKN